MTNLLHLAERLQQASAEQRSPQALLRWLRSERDDPLGSEAAQLRLDSDSNLVQIVTVHKAKGLEYPLVFCPFLWDGNAMVERGEGAEYHDDDNRPVIDFRPGAKQDGEVKRRMRIERNAEELRLIYVALTRAVHRCHVVAGCHGEKHVTGSARSMLNWLVAGDGVAPAAWADHKLGADAIRSAWDGLAATAPQHIVVDALPLGSGTPLAQSAPTAEQIRALPAPPAIHTGWRIGSFSGMLHGAMIERPAADHDVDVAPSAEEAAPPGDDDILGFPRGMHAGTCLHAALERADFADAQSWPAAVRSALTLHPQSLAGEGGRTRLERMALAMIGDVATTQLT
jgi:exodeoxyribonuclease V beta subunit